ncbi:MAG: hypothetical protein BWX98_02408 [Candidatus Aminicenantes bacterium ADurb.Bin147]|nr:MAG: hypothetical protein BWX98_02408 [Candidatus Aminicenantes bacterium ADurb.Bin147]
MIDHRQELRNRHRDRGRLEGFQAVKPFRPADPDAAGPVDEKRPDVLVAVGVVEKDAAFPSLSVPGPKPFLEGHQQKIAAGVEKGAVRPAAPGQALQFAEALFIRGTEEALLGFEMRQNDRAAGNGESRPVVEARETEPPRTQESPAVPPDDSLGSSRPNAPGSAEGQGFDIIGGKTVLGSEAAETLPFEPEEPVFRPHPKETVRVLDHGRYRGRREALVEAVSLESKGHRRIRARGNGGRSGRNENREKQEE